LYKVTDKLSKTEGEKRAYVEGANPNPHDGPTSWRG
jgi:hypothetical protein